MSLRLTRQLARHNRGCFACRFVQTDSRTEKADTSARPHAAPTAVAHTGAAADAVKAAEEQVKAKDNFARMVQLAKPEKHLIGGGLLLLAGTTSISIAVPKVMGDLVDFVMSSDSVAAYTPYHAAGILMGLFAAQSVMLTGRT
jgi:hypothetical protein